MIVRALLAEGRTLLSSVNSSDCTIDSPALDAGLLLGEVLNCSRETLIANGNDEVSADDAKKFRLLLERRLNGECIAYILGRKEFMGLEFIVNPGVLVPRPETEILVEIALGEGDKIAKKTGSGICLLDLCTGSGAIAVSLKHERPDWEIWASDISPDALETAQKNAKLLLHDASKVNFVKSDLLNDIQGIFDLIVSNPPYIASTEIDDLPPEVKREPTLALEGGKDGLEIIKRIINKAADRLKQDGGLILEADPRQMETIKKIFLDNGFTNISITNDLSNRPRVIGGNTKK